MTGEPAANPVVSPTGIIFDRDAIVDIIRKNQSCPITDEPLTVEDLIPLKIAAVDAVPPRKLAGESVPGLLNKFQSEYESLLFERLTLTKQINAIREEISQTLYQNDAACRVIARLMKEKDAITSELDQLQQRAGKAGGTAAGGAPSGKAEGESSLVGLDVETRNKINQKHQELAAMRKQKGPPPTLATVEAIKTYKETASFPHQAARPGILCLDLHPALRSLIVTGGVDKTAVLFDTDLGKKIAVLTGHKKHVNSVLFHPTEELVITGSADCQVWVWGASSPARTSYNVLHQITQHTGEVVQCSLHATSEHLVTASRDATWAFHNINTGQTLLRVQEPDKSPFTCAMLHPDGAILATGTDANEIRIWDLKSQNNVANFPGHTDSITDLCFSENGFYLATAAKDNILKLWDLRGPKNIDSLKMDAAVQKLRYDESGKYLGVATGTEIRIFTGRRLEHVHTLDEHTALVTDLKFGKDATYLASTSLDRTLKLWGK